MQGAGGMAHERHPMFEIWEAEPGQGAKQSKPKHGANDHVPLESRRRRKSALEPLMTTG